MCYPPRERILERFEKLVDEILAIDNSKLPTMTKYALLFEGLIPTEFNQYVKIEYTKGPTKEDTLKSFVEAVKKAAGREG